MASASAAATRPFRVTWSVLHTGGMNEAYVHDVIDRAAAEGIAGIELAGQGVEKFIAYRAFPALAEPVAAELEENQAMLRRLSGHAAEKKLRFGLWHHEIDGPKGLLDRLPELRGADGLIDLDSPHLYRFVTEKLREFFDLFPLVDELVLTLTESAHPVFRRPFCAVPVRERVRRLLRAVLDATEPLGRQLVVRPFSAVREDEVRVREAVEELDARGLSMMYKTEPFDWHAFLPDEPLIGSVAGREARAETDAGAEYYGQAVFPCSYVRHIERRLRAAGEKGAAVAVIRVDRGARHAALGHPVNEGNVIAATRWAMDPARPAADHWRDWCLRRHGFESPELFDLLERTFDVIGKTLYIDRQMFTHNLYPDLHGAKHVQAFGLLEEGTGLDHLERNWGVLSARRTLSHEDILAEKQEAIGLAQETIAAFERLSAAMPEPARAAILESLRRLPILVEGCAGFCRVALAHVEEMWRRPVRTVDAYDIECRRLLELADRIDREKGPKFWLHMADRMRGIVMGLNFERRLEIPLRRQFEARHDVVDYVLCGFAAEGHRLEKMLHSGDTFDLGDRYVRATGLGPEQAFSYRLRIRPNRPHRLVVTLAGKTGYHAPGRIRIGQREELLDAGPLHGNVDIPFDLAASPEEELKVTIWSTAARRVQVAALALLAR